MNANAWRVRVYWTPDEPHPYPLPTPDRRYFVADGPAMPATAAVVHRVPVDRRHPGDRAFADEHLLANAGAPDPWPRVADVLIADGPLGRASDMRTRCPGCLVAVFGRPSGGHLLEVAPGRRARVTLLAGITGDVWPYASFVHAWIATNHPLDALDGICIHEGGSNARVGVRLTIEGRPVAWPAAS